MCCQHTTQCESNILVGKYQASGNVIKTLWRCAREHSNKRGNLGRERHRSTPTQIPTKSFETSKTLVPKVTERRMILTLSRPFLRRYCGFTFMLITKSCYSSLNSTPGARSSSSMLVLTSSPQPLPSLPAPASLERRGLLLWEQDQLFRM